LSHVYRDRYGASEDWCSYPATWFLGVTL